MYSKPGYCEASTCSCQYSSCIVCAGFSSMRDTKRGLVERSRSTPKCRDTCSFTYEEPARHRVRAATGHARAPSETLPARAAAGLRWGAAAWKLRGPRRRHHGGDMLQQVDGPLRELLVPAVEPAGARAPGSARALRRRAARGRGGVQRGAAAWALHLVEVDELVALGERATREVEDRRAAGPAAVPHPKLGQLDQRVAVLGRDDPLHHCAGTRGGGSVPAALCAGKLRWGGRQPTRPHLIGEQDGTNAVSRGAQVTLCTVFLESVPRLPHSHR